MPKLKDFLVPKEQLYLYLANRGYRITTTLHQESAFYKCKGKADVLLVCHCDTVLPPTKPKLSKKKDRIYAQGLDDRLGVYLADKMAHQLTGVDVLVCDHEEIARSTAQFFTGDLEQYNLIIELDRAGEDVVTYGYESEEWLDLLAGYWEIGIGSFSDICMLPDHSLCMCNVGVGYHRAHARDSYLIIEQTNRQYDKIVKFISENRTKRFEADYFGYASAYGDYYDEIARWNDSFSKVSKRKTDEDDYEYLPVFCHICNAEINAWDYMNDYCEYCNAYIGHQLDDVWEEWLKEGKCP